jgi:hypothetical protein
VKLRHEPIIINNEQVSVYYTTKVLRILVHPLGKKCHSPTSPIYCLGSDQMYVVVERKSVAPLKQVHTPGPWAVAPAFWFERHFCIGRQAYWLHLTPYNRPHGDKTCDCINKITGNTHLYTCCTLQVRFVATCRVCWAFSLKCKKAEPFKYMANELSISV